MIFSGRYWQSKILDSSDPEKMLRYAIINGEITDKRIAKICWKLNRMPNGKNLNLKVDGNDITEATVNQFIVEKNR